MKGGRAIRIMVTRVDVRDAMREMEVTRVDKSETMKVMEVEGSGTMGTMKVTTDDIIAQVKSRNPTN